MVGRSSWYVSSWFMQLLVSTRSTCVSVPCYFHLTLTPSLICLLTLSLQVERITSHRLLKVGNKLEPRFLVKWKGYPDSKNTWEPEESFLKAKVVGDYAKVLGFANADDFFRSLDWSPSACDAHIARRHQFFGGEMDTSDNEEAVDTAAQDGSAAASTNGVAQPPVKRPVGRPPKVKTELPPNDANAKNGVSPGAPDGDSAAAASSNLARQKRGRFASPALKSTKRVGTGADFSPASTSLSAGSRAGAPLIPLSTLPDVAAATARLTAVLASVKRSSAGNKRKRTEKADAVSASTSGSTAAASTAPATVCISNIRCFSLAKVAGMLY